MMYWKFSQKKRAKTNFFMDNEKEMGIFFQDCYHSAKDIKPSLSMLHRLMKI